MMNNFVYSSVILNICRNYQCSIAIGMHTNMLYWLLPNHFRIAVLSSQLFLFSFPPQNMILSDLIFVNQLHTRWCAIVMLIYNSLTMNKFVQFLHTSFSFCVLSVYIFHRFLERLLLFTFYWFMNILHNDPWAYIVVLALH